MDRNVLAGLIDLDALMVIDNVLLVPIALAVYFALRRVDPPLVALSTALWLVSIVLTIAANPSVEMLTLSDRFAAATSTVERTAVTAAAESVLATWDGTGFQVAYILGQVAGIVLGFVMLRVGLFGRAVPLALIAGNLIGFGYYLPGVGLALSALAGLVLWAWYFLIGRRFLQLARLEA